MTQNFKPNGYNSVSPYFVTKDARRLADLIMQIFDGKELRSYERPDGSIMHMEVQVDDSVIMIGESTREYSPNTQMVHVYVSDVDTIFKKAMILGCNPVDEPVQKGDDPDKRGSFTDFAGNFWSVGMQVE